ncbi:hypothetical protein NC651_040455 [Populus alba x Populus x berolinensis]|nr:hypothetical protein NC651_040455 [Populus alba x Populus x berolinensis]
MTPAAFEKHSGRETARKWKNNVWVIVNGEKVPLSKTVLLKYYNQASKNGNGSHRSNNGRVCHRDEFVRCSKCNKERRFRLRTKEECQIHHDALADANWKCADMPFDKITCDDDEERASRRVYRGCTRSPTCKGCTSCVCFGCEICRFSDCSCQTCTDFTRNAKQSISFIFSFTSLHLLVLSFSSVPFPSSSGHWKNWFTTELKVEMAELESIISKL